MNNETKRLAIVATFCFFPLALIGFWVRKDSETSSLKLFRASIYTFLLCATCAGTYIMLKGGAVIKILQAFL